MKTTVDGFLDGRIMVEQPVSGYRAATDPVYLAAAVNAKAGQSVLELGCGAGVASLCLAWRVSGLSLSGLELQPDYADLARANARRNDLDLRVFCGDLRRMPNAMRNESFDHVMMNPPFFVQGAVSAPQSAGKQTAHVEEADLGVWIHVGLRRLRPGGVLTLVHLAERLPEILSQLVEKAGNIVVLPLAARTGQPAKRVIIRAVKAARGPFELLPPFVVHSGDAHQQGVADYSDLAQAVLRDGAALPMGL